MNNKTGCPSKEKQGTACFVLKTRTNVYGWRFLQWKGLVFVQHDDNRWLFLCFLSCCNWGANMLNLMSGRIALWATYAIVCNGKYPIT